MTQKLILLLSLAVCTLCSCSQNVADRDDWYELSWHDEFNGKTINDSIWSKMKRIHGVNCVCNLTSDGRMYDVRKGRLRLYARYNDGLLPNDTARFLTGGVTSEGKRTFTYGKIEVRVRLHGAVGTWPAIWTMPDDRKYWKCPNPKYTEIDILEYVNRNDEVYQTAHNAYTLADRKNRSNPRQAHAAPVKADRYNIYSVEILPDVLIFAVNGKETFRYLRVKEYTDQFPYGIESHIMMDMQVYPPDFWSKGVRPETFPAYMDIDWIRVYKLKQPEKTR